MLNRAIVPAVVTGASLAVAVLGLGAVFGRRVVGSYAHAKVRIVASAAGSVTFRANPKTTHPGVFGLWFDGGHARIGEVISADAVVRTVERRLLEVEGPLEAARAEVWEGDVFRGPASVAPYRDVMVPMPLGPTPAWLFEVDDSTTWAIHVHGVRTTRINAARTVVPVKRAGMTSLVIAYRGDGEGPAVPGGAATLGLTEWRDVDAAIAFAVAQGAKKIVLVGWSMGASVALLASERSEFRGLIAGMVLVSPATEWRATMRQGAKKLKIPFPGVCAGLTEFVLSNPVLCRTTGLSHPIDFDALDWTVPGRLKTPCLVVHSGGDRTIPLAVSRGFAAANPGQVELHESVDADHAWEYNVGPDEFNEVIEAWLIRTVAG